MSVTFLLGNGFDINCGMRSTYKDAYKDYVKSPPNGDEILERFRKDIKEDERLQFETWADFEMGMGEYAKTFSSENDFIKCVRDFKAYLHDYLSNEQNRVLQLVNKHSHECGKEMAESIVGFYQTGLTQNGIRNIQRFNDGSYSIISYNYTDKLLRRLIRLTSLGINDRVVHIHGTLSNDVVLGVDNEKQIQNESFTLTKRGKRAFIKPVLNAQSDISRVETAMLYIRNADVLCVFGMSLGDSDTTWRNTIKTWLLENENHQLVYFKYGIRDIPAYLLDDRIDEEERQKEGLLKLLGVEDKEWDSSSTRIHIPISSNIFAIKDAIEKAEEEESRQVKVIPSFVATPPVGLG